MRIHSSSSMQAGLGLSNPNARDVPKKRTGDEPSSTTKPRLYQCPCPRVACRCVVLVQPGPRVGSVLGPKGGAKRFAHSTSVAPASRLAPVKRIQFIEIHDQTWCPRVIRDTVTDVLRVSADQLQPYRQLIPRILEAVDASGAQRVVDLCSGGGGPWPGMLKRLPDERRGSLEVLLTDRFPNLEAFSRAEARAHTAGVNLRGRREPLDAMNSPAELHGMRTLFASFHHFPPDAARRILQDAIDKGAPIGIFEITERSPRTIAFIAGSAPLGALLGVPLAGLTPLRALLTYVFPLIPFILGVDGVVSCLRTYSPAELREMTASLQGGERYDWDIGTLPPRPLPVTYLIGTPREPAR